MRRAVAVAGLIVALAGAVRAHGQEQAPAPPADRPLSRTEIADLFKESATLGTEMKAIVDELAPVLEQGKALESRRVLLDAEVVAFNGRKDRASAQCRGELPEAQFAACQSLEAQLRTERASLASRAKELDDAIDRHNAVRSPLFQRGRVVRARLEEIQALLARQQAFATASDDCRDKGSAEAVVQCMERSWDGASDAGYTVESGPRTVVTPNSGPVRTPERAIKEYLDSGKKPGLRRRPSGGKEPPPPK